MLTLVYMHTWLCASSFAHNGPRPEATPRGDDQDSAIIGFATDEVTANNYALITLLCCDIVKISAIFINLLTCF